MRVLGGVICLALSASAADDVVWTQTEALGRQTQQAIAFCHRYAHGWLAHADAESGLLPRTLRGDFYWNARDCAADNFPFLTLTAHLTGDAYLISAAERLLAQEIALTSRVGSLPDTFDFRTQAFLKAEVDWAEVVFGASEYAKDGLMPVSEWMGPSPWLDRMTGIVPEIWAQATVTTPVGPIPTDNIEVAGDLLQVTSRLYWLTREPRYKEWAYRLADLYLLHWPLPAGDRIALRDHGCEIISGLTEAYVIAALEDPERREAYREPLYALLDCILEKGVRPDGMMPNAFNPQTGGHVGGISDGWGYVYDAFLTVAMVDGVERYREAPSRALAHVREHLETDWEGGGADGYADSVEGAINLLNRLDVPEAHDWIDASMQVIFSKQRSDGIIEGWYGDGNSARTAMMWALWKTQGVSVAPWRPDLRVGAVRGEDGALYVQVSADWAWRGEVRLDRPRHRLYFGLPLDYPRINQFPEWFAVAAEDAFVLTVRGSDPVRATGGDLWRYPLELGVGGSVQFAVQREGASVLDGRKVPGWPERRLRYAGGDAAAIAAWRAEARSALAAALRLEDLLGRTGPAPLAAEAVSESTVDGYARREVTLQSTPGRRVAAVVTTPLNAPAGPAPAVVCIAGHGGDRYTPYDDDTIYHRFGAELARRGAVTISVDVGQHEVREQGRTLMGERLWDLVRAVDYLAAMPEVDATRIGCVGLSLGGEMAMWLGAMDDRIAVTVSAGFLTYMDQLERNHCMCWKFEGLRDLVDFPDVYALVAPRALLCQNGKREPADQFPPAVALRALEEIRPAFADQGAEGALVFVAHDGGHEIDMPSMWAFLAERLGVSPE